LLVRHGEIVCLPPKVFDTLVVLIEKNGRLIEKDELISALWPDTFVEEATLARNISDLRKALGESAGDGKFIETVPKRGYRFTAVVRRSQPDGPSVIVETPEASQDRKRIKSLAVLPFRPMSVVQDEYLELGIADALITRLSNIRQIVVRPTSTVRKYANSPSESVSAGAELKVDYVLDGAIQKTNDRIRVTAQLVSVADGTVLWAKKFDEGLTDIFTIEDVISEQAAAALGPKLSGEEKRLIIRHDTNNAEAHRLCLKGRFYWNKRTREGYEKGIEQFNQAIELDSSYARAYAGLADCYSMLGRFGLVNPAEIMPKAVSAANRALALDDDLAESHASVALANHNYLWDWPRVEQHYARAIVLNPSFATARHWYAVFLAETGRAEEAIAQIKLARDLDPVSLIIGADMGMILYLCRDFDLAIEQCRATLEMDPAYFRARMWLGRAYEQKGLYREAIAEYQTARSLDETPYVLEWLARTYSLAENNIESDRLIQELDQLSARVYVDSYYLASVYAARDQKKEAIEGLERAREERSCWMCRLRVDPIFDRLRQEPEFEQLIMAIGS